MPSRERYDIIIAGAGPAGLAAACLAGKRGVKSALVTGPRSSTPDPRTVALMQPSLEILSEIGLWPGSVRDEAAPLRKLRLVDDTGAMISAPEITFDAQELDLDAFGWNIPLAALSPALEEQARSLGVEIFVDSVAAFEFSEGASRISLKNGTGLSAPLVLAADGRDSLLRAAAGIGLSHWSYDQSALALTFSHSAPHRGISTEYHKPAGPFTTVPLPGLRSSLVWMERLARAAELMAFDDRTLAAEIQILSHGDLGLISDIGPRQAFPMSGLRADSFAKSRVMLIGEAAHVVPPIGAQGLNLSLRDAGDAVALAAEAVKSAHDPGAPDLLAEYDRMRRRDVAPRQSIVDLMNRSLLSGLLPLEAGRAAGLAALDAFRPLRRLAMTVGMGLRSER